MIVADWLTRLQHSRRGPRSDPRTRAGSRIPLLLKGSLGMHCENCGVELPAGVGRPRSFCSDACAKSRRQAMARLGAAVKTVTDAGLIVARRGAPSGRQS